MEQFLAIKALCFSLLLAVYFVNIAKTADDPYWFNLSLNRTVTPSSTAINGEPEKAVDGKTAPRPDSCAKTLESSNPYVLIDLGEEVYPTIINLVIDFDNVVNYYDIVTQRLGNNADYLANDIIRRRSVYHGLSTVNHVTKGRYLSIELEETAVLSICEVYAFRIPFDDIAHRKPVESSREVTRDPTGLNAFSLVDHSFNWPSAYTDNMVNPWMRLDLQDSFFIREVILFAAYGRTISDFAIRIGHSLSDGGRANPSCIEHQSIGIYEGKAFFCRMKGRYIVLTTDTTTPSLLEVSEMFVNPTHQENLAERRPLVLHPNGAAGKGGHVWHVRLNDNLPGGGSFITPIGTSGNWLRVDLGESFSVVKIVIANDVQEGFENQLVNFELRVAETETIFTSKKASKTFFKPTDTAQNTLELTRGNNLENDGNSNPLCLPGLHSMLGKWKDSFYCEPPVIGRYVNLNQKTVNKHLALSEIGVYSEAEPEIRDRFKRRQIWSKIGETVVMSCDAYGQPVPMISWIKDNNTLSIGSSSLEIQSASTEDSGVYECWANNSHGEQYMPFHLTVTSDLRPCVDSEEIQYDLGRNKPVFDTEFFENKWYRFYDDSVQSYLEMIQKVPRTNAFCSAWMTGQHPGIADGVVQRSACETGHGNSCNRQFNIRVRNCPGYYVYNVPWSQAEMGFPYCFHRDTGVRHRPPISTMVKANNALFNRVFHLEKDISDPSYCLILCSLTEQCKSFNYSDQEKICELNSSTKQKHAADFLHRHGYHYSTKGKGIMSRKFGDL